MLELLHKALYALISGFSELFFVSTSAHQLLYRTVTGYDLNDGFLAFGIHAGCLAALLVNCRQRIKYLRNQKRLQRPGKRRRGRQPDLASLIDIRILNTAVIPLVLGFLVFGKAAEWFNSTFRVAGLLIVNACVLFLPRLLRSGDKDARSFSLMDSLLMGLSGMLGMFPGLSRLGCMYSVGTARGAQKNYVLELSILLCIPAVAVMLCMDLYSCTVALAGITFLQMLGALVAMAASFLGAHLAIKFIRIICNRSSTLGFAYYSWGLAVFMLLIYLFVS